jgi:plasmid stabilization system protein ParE
MARGDKSAYTDKQRRMAEHIEEGYEDRGVSENEAEARAWATVNAMTGGGKKSGSGRGKRMNTAPARKGGRKAATSRKRSTAKRSTAKRGTAKRSTAKRSTAKRSTAKRSTARRGSTKRSTAKRSAAKRSSSRKRSTRR